MSIPVTEADLLNWQDSAERNGGFHWSPRVIALVAEVRRRGHALEFISSYDPYRRDALVRAIGVARTALGRVSDSTQLEAAKSVQKLVLGQSKELDKLRERVSELEGEINGMAVLLNRHDDRAKAWKAVFDCMLDCESCHPSVAHQTAKVLAVALSKARKLEEDHATGTVSA